jgi:hypothetical protein
MKTEKKNIFCSHLERHLRKEQDPDPQPQWYGSPNPGPVSKLHGFRNTGSYRTVPTCDVGALFVQGVYKEMSSNLLTNSALVYEPKCGGEGELRGLSQ